MKFKSGFFVIGTDTDIGKTYVSALLYKTLRKYNTHYFKPVQSGCFLRDNKLIAPDVDFVCNLSNENYNDDMVLYTLKKEVSPHLAAEAENIEIDSDKIQKKVLELKEKYEHIIFEGAGGLYVPLVRDKFYIYDLIKLLNLKVLLVSGTKVGSINHAMQTIEALKNMKIDLLGIVFNKYTNKDFEQDNIKNILSMSKLKNYLIINENQKELEEEQVLEFLEDIYE